MTDACFQLKGSVITTFILELYDYSRDDFTRQLTDKINQAADFFHQSPVVISLDKCQQTLTDSDLAELISICRQHKLQVMAFKSADNRFNSQIAATGLTLLTDSTSRASGKQPAPTETTPVADNSSGNAPDTTPNTRKSKVISKPVRSGQQVYAEGADLIILSQVSEGAEVLADGNIHIYGALRGRALAGIKGDSSARVFCLKLEAELISIAGNFILSDSMRKQAWKQAVQVYLDEQTLHVEAL